MRRPLSDRFRLAEERDRRAHRGGIGVVALVDQRRGRPLGKAEPMTLAPPLRRRQLAEREHRLSEVAAHHRDRGKHGEAVLDEVPPGSGELVGDLLAEDRRRDAGAFRLQLDQPQMRLCLRMFAEADDALYAGLVGAARRGAHSADCRD